MICRRRYARIAAGRSFVSRRFGVPQNPLSGKMKALHPTALRHCSSRTSRNVLIDSSSALVEDWSTQEVALTKSAEDYSPKTQICFPYRGVFIWHVGAARTSWET